MSKESTRSSGPDLADRGPIPPPSVLEGAIRSLTSEFGVFDKDDRLLIASSGLAIRCGCDADRLIGRSLDQTIGCFVPQIFSVDGIDCKAAGPTSRSLSKLLDGRETKTIEIEFDNDDWRLMTLHATPDGGRVLEFSDISHLRRAEKAARYTEQMVQRILEACPLPLAMVRLSDQKILYESPENNELFGENESSRASHVGVYDVDPSERKAYLARLRRDGVVKNHEIRFRRLDGTEFTAALSGRLIEFDGEEVIVSGVVDLTESKLRETELRRARETLEDAIEALSEGFSLYDSEDHLVICNTRFRELNEPFGDLFEPGVSWQKVTRARAEAGMFPAAKGRVEDYLREKSLKRGEAEDDEFKLSDGRWIEMSHRRSRQGGVVHTWRDVTERKTMEQALRESEELVRRVVDDCPLPINMTSVDGGRIIFESPASKAAFGVPQNGGSCQVQDRYVHPKHRDRLISKARTRGFVDDMEFEFRRADGSTFIGSVSTRLVEYRGEQVLVSSTVDQTARKKREDALRHARETLEDAIESLSEGFALFDEEERLVTCNTRYKELNEPFGDLLVPGTQWDDISRARAEHGFFREADGRVEDWLRERREKRRRASKEEFELKGDRTIETSHRQTRQGGTVITWQDITERKTMEQALRDSEERVRHVLEACPAPITMNRVDDGVILYESPATRALLKSDEPQEGRSVTSRWDDPEQRQAFLERLRLNGSVDGFEIRYRKSDGEVFWCSLSARLIEFRGEPVIVSHLFDLTDRREAEAELAHQREMLHQVEKLGAMGELLAGVSHELNNPLSVLVGQALMLQETAPDEATAARAEKIGKAADRCARIVKTFLAMARREPAETVAVDLNGIIEGALEMTGYALRTSGIEVSVRMAKELPTVMADPDQLRQVVTNLIVNAQHALQDLESPRKLRITTTHSKKNNQVTMKVKDNGPGIAPEIRTRIFEPFYTTKEVGTGTGIGLALCHRIVEAHGGTIAVENVPDQGAVFAVRLPCVAPKGAGAKAIPRRAIKAARFRILVVDDEEDVGLTISEVLEQDGHAVDVAGSGQVALEKIKRQTYDVILSDIRMEGMDGPSLYRALSETQPEMIAGLAFITGDTLSPRVNEFLDVAERPFLEKPIMPKDVRELVDLLTRRKTC